MLGSDPRGLPEPLDDHPPGLARIDVRGRSAGKDEHDLRLERCEAANGGAQLGGALGGILRAGEWHRIDRERAGDHRRRRETARFQLRDALGVVALGQLELPDADSLDACVGVAARSSS